MPRKISTPGDGAKQLMLESAIFLMRQSGLSGAATREILAHSKAPKGSMYYYFPKGKLQLTAEALELFGQRVAAAFDKTLASQTHPVEKIRALFRFIAERFEQARFEQSCAAGAVTLDIQTEVEELRPVVAKAMASWQETVAQHLPMRSAARARSFAGLVISAIEGGYIRGRAERSSQPLIQAGDWLAILIKEETRDGRRRSP